MQRGFLFQALVRRTVLVVVPGILGQHLSQVLLAEDQHRIHALAAKRAPDGREKVVTLTPRALDYLAAQRRAARRIERVLRDLLGAEAFDDLSVLLDAVGGQEDQPCMCDYLRYATRLEQAEST